MGPGARTGAALYVRPFMFGSEPHLSVRPATEYLFVVIASPVAAYFGAEASAITVGVERDDVRATRGRHRRGEVRRQLRGRLRRTRSSEGGAGYDQVLWLDAVEHRWVEELNAMNVMFVWDRGGRTVLSTPPLTGTILDGVTRDSLLQLAADGPGPDDGSAPVAGRGGPEPTSIDQIRDGVADGSLREVFACGTAAVIAPIGRLVDAGAPLRIGDGGPGAVTMELRRRMFDVQYGRTEDPHSWRSPVGQMLRDGAIDPDQPDVTQAG